MPLILTHPACDDLPAAARKALCDPPAAYVTLAEDGDRKLAIAVHVEDGRAWDGPYFERRAYWTSWKTDEDSDRVGAFLAGLGPVTGRADAWARMTLVAGEMGGSGGGPPSVVVPEGENAACPAGLGDFAHGHDLACGVMADPAHPGAFIGRTSYVDALSCECSVTWSKVYLVEFHVTPDGVVSHTAKQAACDAWPKWATKDVCGK